MAKARKSHLPERHVPKTVEWLWANEGFEQRYPILFELLAAGLYEGEPRVGATLTLFVSDGRLKVSLSDRHTEQVLYLTLEPFDDILAEVEVLLAKGGDAWKSTHKNGSVKAPF